MAGQRSRPTTAGGSSRPSIVIADIYDAPVEDEDALLIYKWLDTLEFSRAKKTGPSRDFADGVMMAELVAHYIPRIINPRYYVKTSASAKKISNWEQLNNKVFKRIGFQLTPDLIQELAAARPGMIEKVLLAIRPILFKGSKAILPLLKKLENVKPRFMDIEKSYLKKKPERPQTAEATVTSRPSSRPHSAVKSSAPSRQRTPSQSKNSSVPSAPPPSAATSDLEAINDSRSSRTFSKQSPRSRSLSNRTDALAPTEDSKIFTRPSTGRSSNETPSPTDLLSGVHNLKEKLDQRCRDNHNVATGGVSSNKRGFPTRSTWLPVEGDDQLSGKGRSIHSANVNTDVLTDSEDNEQRENKIVAKINNLNKTGNNGKNSEEEADEEIYCDQSGYEEDTEDEDATEAEETDEGDDTVYLPSSGDGATSNGKRRNRKLKRVIKYEYREEYILNGMASFQLPNSTQLENVRKTFMNPGNKDPNCRGYGFV